MTDTTYDEARRCPKCNELGEKISDEPARGYVTQGARIHKIVCLNERCVWAGQVSRMIQVNPDGTIPPPMVKRDKQYPKVPDLTDKVNENLARQLELERDGNAEIQTR